MTDSSQAVGNGLAYQEKLSSSKLTSVLEAVAGEYALVINGHSLVSVAILSLRSIFPESTSLRTVFMAYLALISLGFRGAVVFKWTRG